MDQDNAALRVDHVLLAVNDLAQAAGVLNDRYGLVSAEGGRHPQWGTANRIIPVGDAYLELIAVVDPNRVRDSAFGRWVAGAQPGIMHPLGWAVRGLGVDDVAQRLDLAIEAGSRAAPDGRLVEW
ncbi:MAG TPA: VOC family protein, partial [Ilumatobacter sp.]